ncbi:MAG TPA: HAD family phosphatase [Myxococcota bacterium]|jgi:HAD superfamily hydrolase (TIGR01509 family)
MRPGSARAIVFDFDGVIADSEAIANRVLAACLSEIGLATSYEDALDVYCGRRWSECVAQIETRLAAPLPTGFLERCYARTHEQMERALAPVPGVADFLARTAHLARAIASSSREDYLAAALARLGLDHHFGGRLFSAADLARGKPHPDIYLRAAAGLGVAPEGCIAIEDSPIGVTSARAANMHVIGLVAASHIRPGDAERLSAAGAHRVARSYAEIAEVVLVPG